MKYLTSFQTSFLRCHKEIANLPEYFVWAYLAKPIRNNIINLLTTFMFISMQNINFITQFSLEILQRYCILDILSTLGMPLPHTLKMIVSTYRQLRCSMHKKSTSSLTFFLRYYKDFANMLFLVIWAGLVMPTNTNGINF